MPAPTCARHTSWEKSLLHKTSKAGCPGNQRDGSSPTQPVGVQGYLNLSCAQHHQHHCWGDQAHPHCGSGSAACSSGLLPAPDPFRGVERAWLSWVWGLICLFISRQSLPDVKSMLAGGRGLHTCNGNGLNPSAGSGPLKVTASMSPVTAPPGCTPGVGHSPHGHPQPWLPCFHPRGSAGSP